MVQNEKLVVNCVNNIVPKVVLTDVSTRENTCKVREYK